MLALLTFVREVIQDAWPDPSPSAPAIVQQQPDPAEIDRRVDERVDERLREIEQQRQAECDGEPDGRGLDRRGGCG